MAHMPSGLSMNWQDRQAKGSELIAFLSAWGITRTDAQNILSLAYAEIKTLDNSGFIAKGRELGSLMGMTLGSEHNV